MSVSLGQKRVNPKQLNYTITFPNGVEINPYTDILLFVGRKKSGKSYACDYYTRPVKRLIVWDYNWEHKDKVIVHSLEELAQWWQMTAAQNVKRVAYQPHDKSVEEFDRFCDWIVNSVRYCCILVEELAQVANSQTVQNPKLNKGFKTIVGSGRHDYLNLGLACTERRFQGLPASVTANADHIFIFRQQRKDDWDLACNYADESQVISLQNSGVRHTYLYIGYTDKTLGETKFMPPVSKR